MDAVEKGDAGLIRRLIAAGKDVNESSGDETPLHWAAGAGKDDIVLLLLEKGSLIDPKNGALQTPLMMAARRGNAESVRLLVENGADLDARDAQNQTALDQAQNHGHHEVAKVLHQAKKDRI
jgi:ankyrin repeat protein